MALNSLPNDPMMLFSFVNTRLRDDGITLDEFAAQFGVQRSDIESVLDKLDYTYNGELNKFI
jgi:hypothetical protein